MVLMGFTIFPVLPLPFLLQGSWRNEIAGHFEELRQNVTVFSQQAPLGQQSQPAEELK